MRLQIGKWGNSLAVRLPAGLTQQASLKEGDLLEAEVAGDGRVLLSAVQYFDKDAFLVELDKLHDALPRTEPVMDQLREEARY
jgi:antitoxin MazE